MPQNSTGSKIQDNFRVNVLGFLRKLYSSKSIYTLLCPNIIFLVVKSWEFH